MTFIQRIIHQVLTNPIHPLIVHFPIVLTSAALLFIILSLWKKSNLLEQVAFANIALAAVSVPFAMALGLYENIKFYAGNAPNFHYKIIFASLLFIVTVVTSIYRWRNPDLMYKKSTKLFYIGAYFVGFGICTILGLFGSIIMYGGF